MTALCGGGSSGAKPGVAQTVIYTSQALSNLLAGKGAAWAVLVAPILSVLAYDALDLCQTDPPAQPTISAAEYQALLDLGPFDLFTSGLAKLKDLATIAIWFEICACTSVATPPQSSALWTPPSGVSLPNNAGACPQARARLTASQGSGTAQFPSSTNRTAIVFPNLPIVQSGTNATAVAQDIVAIDPTWTAAAARADYVSGASTPSVGFLGDVIGYDANKMAVGLFWGVQATPSTPHDDDPNTGFRPINHAQISYLSVNAQRSLSQLQDGLFDFSMDFQCAAAGTPITNCCTDTTVSAQISNLTSMVQQLQRFALPFAYIKGQTFPNLSGSGSQALDRSVGLQLQVLAAPAGNKRMLGVPEYIFDLGWVSVLTADGMVDEIRLTRDNTTWLSKLIPSATSVGWGLRDGVTISITELFAET